MTALLETIREAGVTVEVINGKLKCRGPQDAVSRLLPVLRERKSELLRLLAAKRPEPAEPALQPVLAWLHFIGENNREILAEVLDKCRTDAEALAYYLARAEGREPTAPAVEPGPAGSGELWVLCWTPAGNPLRIRARDAEHAEWLRRMNSPPREDRQ